MKKMPPIGISDYEKIMSHEYFRIDKTLMIKEFLDRGSEVTLITRPRRFGKTLNMSMMAHFFDITEDSYKLFEGTKIMATEYAKEMNQWPVIFISFAGAKHDKETMIEHIKRQVVSQYMKYEHVLSHLNRIEERMYGSLIDKITCFDSDLRGMENALLFLMKKMNEYYHKKVMLFIDEYDTPFIEAHVEGFYEEIRGQLVLMFLNALKDCIYLHHGMLTGIQRVAKENIFSDLNNLVVCTVESQQYSRYFGFTEDETRYLLEYYGLELSQEVCHMYDGYHFGNQNIYNPWSIINYADNHQLKPYWVNTSANKMIRKAMEMSDLSFKQGYEKLIQEGYLETQVILETSFFEVSSTAALWGLFVNAGYLTIENNIEGTRYRVKVPNQEVQEEFKSLTASYLKVSNTTLDDMFYAIKTDNKEMFITNYQNVWQIPSYYDLIQENSYHMMMLGMCAWLMNDYEIISNRETGSGRSDIILKPKKQHLSTYIFEFKHTKENTKALSLEVLAKKAIHQISENHYDEGLSGKVIMVGLAHSKKEVVVEWYERDEVQ